MDMRIPPLRIKIMLSSNPLKSMMLVLRLAVDVSDVSYPAGGIPMSAKQTLLSMALVFSVSRNRSPYFKVVGKMPNSS